MEDDNRLPENVIPEDEELPESEELLTEEYDSVFDDVSLQDDDVILTDDDVPLEAIQEVSEEEDELPEDDQPLLAAIQEVEVEDPHKLAIEQIDLALAHLSNNAERLKVLETHIEGLENDSDSSEDRHFEVDQASVNELKTLVARLEDEVHCIQIQQLQAQINSLNVSAAVSDQKLNANREQLALKEQVLQDSSTLICSLTNALDNARNETKAVQASLNVFKRRCRKAERKSLADRRRVTTSAARHEASLIEQDNLQARVEELETLIDNMGLGQENLKEMEVPAEVRKEGLGQEEIQELGVPTEVREEGLVQEEITERGVPAEVREEGLGQDEITERGVPAEVRQEGLVQEEIKELEVPAEVREENDNVVNTETSDPTKTTDKVTPNESKLISKLALIKRGYNKMLGYTMMLEAENKKLRQTVEPNELVLDKLTVLEKARDVALEQAEQQQNELREVQFKLDNFEGMLEIPLTPFIHATIVAAAAMEKSQQDFYSGETMPMCPNIYRQPPVQPVPPSPKYVVPSTVPVSPLIINEGTTKEPNENSNDKDSPDSDSSSDGIQVITQASTETVQPPNIPVQPPKIPVQPPNIPVQPPTLLVQPLNIPLQKQTVTSTEEVQHSAETLTDQAQVAAGCSTSHMTVNAECQTIHIESTTEQVQPNLTEAQYAPPMMPTPPLSFFQQPGYVIPPAYDPFGAFRPGSHSFVYKETRDNRRCRWCWCALIPRNTVQCQVCKILVHNTCKNVVPCTCGYPDPIWNHYISLPVSNTEMPATQSYMLPNPCCWVIFHRVRSARRYVMLYGSSINIYLRVPGPYDMPLEAIPLQMCGLMPRLIVDLNNRFRGPNVDKCIAYQQMVTPNRNRRPGTTFILEFGNHWDRECFIDAITLFIATLTPPGPFDHFQNK